MLIKTLKNKIKRQNPRKRLSAEVYPPPKKKPKLVHDDLSPHNANSRAVFTFCYQPKALSHNTPQGFITNKITALYQAISPARLDLLRGIKENKPPNIQQLANSLNRDYSIVWRDIRALEKIGIVQLRKASKGKSIKPTLLIEKLIIEVPFLEN